VCLLGLHLGAFASDVEGASLAVLQVIIQPPQGAAQSEVARLVMTTSRDF
jgi:hypothetical protein